MCSVVAATQIVLSKSGVRHLHDSCTQHEKCRRILKHVLKSYNSRSHNRHVRMASCLPSLLHVSSAHHRSHMQKSQAKKVLSKSALRESKILISYWQYLSYMFNWVSNQNLKVNHSDQSQQMQLMQKIVMIQLKREGHAWNLSQNNTGICMQVTDNLF